ncbi:MAG: alpha/beta hydrolase, partial [Ramlibacter sp.]
MKLISRWAWLLATLLGGTACWAQGTQVVDIPSRPGITERMLLALPAGKPSAVVLLLTGGNGQVGIYDNGSLRNEGNFLVRSRALFVSHGLAALVLDPPSDHSRAPFLGGTFRDSAEHMADIGAAVAWARQRFSVPVWVVGTSRGTHSAANAAVMLAGASAPDGIVLTSSVLAANRGGGATARPVQETALEKAA